MAHARGGGSIDHNHLDESIHPHVGSEYGENRAINSAKPIPKIHADHHCVSDEPSARHPPPPPSADVRCSDHPPTHPPSATHIKSQPPSNFHHAMTAALAHHDHPYRSLQSIHYFDRIPPPVPPHFSGRSKKKGIEPMNPDMISRPSQRCLLRTPRSPQNPAFPNSRNSGAMPCP
jgi:hypothetical protein